MVLVKIVRLMGLVLLLLLGVVFIGLISLLQIFIKPPAMTLAFAQLWYRALLTVMNVQVQVHGHYQHQGALVCSNHISWLDIPVIGSVIPSYFLSKAELRKTPVLGWLAAHAGTLFIHRGTGQIEEVKQLMQAYLGNDHCLTFFPEATTGNGYAIRQFHPRLFSAAIATKTSILPVALQYHGGKQPNLSIAFADESMATNLWRILGRRKTTVDISLLPLIDSVEKDRKALANSAMHAIADVMNLPAQRRGLDFRAPLPDKPAETHQP